MTVVHDTSGEVVSNRLRGTSNRRRELLESYECFIHHKPFYEKSVCVFRRWLSELSLQEIAQHKIVDPERITLISVCVGNDVDEAEIYAERIADGIEALGDSFNPVIVARGIRTGLKSFKRFIEVFNSLSTQHLYHQGKTLLTMNSPSRLLFKDACREPARAGLTIVISTPSVIDKKIGPPLNILGTGVIWCDLTKDDIPKVAHTVSASLDKSTYPKQFAPCGLILSSTYDLLDVIQRLGLREAKCVASALGLDNDLLRKHVKRMNKRHELVVWSASSMLHITDIGRTMFGISDASYVAIGTGEVRASEIAELEAA